MNLLKRLVSLNLVILLVLTIILPSSTTVSEAINNSITINGITYDAEVEQAGDGWVYHGDGRLDLKNYSGGAISATGTLFLYIQGTAVVNANTGSPAISSEKFLSIQCARNSSLTVNGGKGADTIYSAEHVVFQPGEGSIRVHGIESASAVSSDSMITICSYNFIAWSDSGAALKCKSFEFNIGNSAERLDIYVGDNKDNESMGTYISQSYVRAALRNFEVTLYGNGGKTSSGLDCITKTTSSSNLSLYDYQNTFTKENSTQVSWGESSSDSGVLHSLDEVYHFPEGTTQAALYALWSNDTIKSVNLIDYGDGSRPKLWNKVIPCKTNETIILPKATKVGAKFNGWLDKDGITLYPAGTELTISDNMSLTAQYSPLKLIIDGKEYDASVSHYNDSSGWEYYVRNDMPKAQFNIRYNYSGKPIFVPIDARINLISISNISGNDGIPAIKVDGSLDLDFYNGSIYKAGDYTILGGTGAPAIEADGAIDIYVSSDSDNNALIIGGEKEPAIRSGGKIIIASPMFYVGINNENLNMVGKYSGESFVKISGGDFHITASGNTTIPNVPERENYVFLGWISKAYGSYLNYGWYMPGEQINFSKETRLDPFYLNKNKNTKAIVFNGNGGTTGDNSNNIVCLASSGDLQIFKPDKSFEYKNHIQTGWNTTAKGDGISYSSIDTSMFSDSLITKIFAQWKATVPSENGGGSSSGDGGGSGASGGSSGGSGGSSTIISPENLTNSTISKIKISAEISSGNASALITKPIVDSLLNNVNKKTERIEIFIDSIGTSKNLEIGIGQAELDKIAASTSNLALTSPLVSISLDRKAIETISSGGKGEKVVIKASIVGDFKGKPVYDFTVVNGDKKISDFNGGQAVITIPYSLQSGENPNAIVVYYLASDGNIQTVRGFYDIKSKTVKFITKHFSKFTIGYNPIIFKDVDVNAWYKDAVDFISARGIANGVGGSNYKPDENLTRGQFLVMLMKAYQIDSDSKNEFKETKQFDDAGATYYTDYLLTAKGLGIVKGKGNNLFAPDEDVTRQEMFTMLYNALKVTKELPTTDTGNQLKNFSDAEQADSWSKEALISLVKAGIITGDNSTLKPKATTSRAEMAQVLFNLLSK